MGSAGTVLVKFAELMNCLIEEISEAVHVRELLKCRNVWSSEKNMEIWIAEGAPTLRCDFYLDAEFCGIARHGAWLWKIKDWIHTWSRRTNRRDERKKVNWNKSRTQDHLGAKAFNGRTGKYTQNGTQTRPKINAHRLYEYKAKLADRSLKELEINGNTWAWHKSLKIQTKDMRTAMRTRIGVRCKCTARRSPQSRMFSRTRNTDDRSERSRANRDTWPEVQRLSCLSDFEWCSSFSIARTLNPAGESFHCVRRQTCGDAEINHPQTHVP